MSQRDAHKLKSSGSAQDGGDFWSRRRAAVAAEAQADVAAAEAEERQAVQADVEAQAAEKTDAEILADLGLKDPDEMQAGDDFSAFMAEAVPARLRKRALRRLWRSNPVLANVDMLVDYGEDFTDSAMILENMQTAYQVGKGMLRHVEALAEAQEAKEAEEAEAALAAQNAQAEEETLAEEPLSENPEPADMAEATPPEAAIEVSEDDPREVYDHSRIVEDEAAHALSPKRRMRFDFPTETVGIDRKGDA